MASQLALMGMNMDALVLGNIAPRRTMSGDIDITVSPELANAVESKINQEGKSTRKLMLLKLALV